MESSVDPAELLRRCGWGDEAALAELIANYESRVYRMTARASGDAALAEEATVETFYKVWKGASGWNGDSSPDAWIFRIASRTTKDLIRSRNRWWKRIWRTAARSEIDDTPTPDEAAGNAEQIELESKELNRLLESMNNDDRMLVTLYYWENMPLTEISGILDASADALKMRLVRLRKRLARLLEPPNVD